MVKPDTAKCHSRYFLKLLTKHVKTLGNIFPNIFKLLSVSETLIISTSAVERVLSKVQLNVIVQVSTTHDIQMVSINNDNIESSDLNKVVHEFRQGKKGGYVSDL